MKVLIVDDDHELVDLLAFAFQRAGLSFVVAYNGAGALRALEADQPDLVVLDVNLGADNGFEVLQRLRQRTEIPVIMLTGRDAENDKVLGLQLGADDYVTKPFSHRELIARVQAHLRRQGREGPTARPVEPSLTAGPITLDTARHTVTKNGRPVELSVTEFRLLHYLMLNADTVVSTRLLLRHVWGYDDPGGSEVSRVALHRLRQKVEDDPSNPTLIQTIPGVGVMFTTRPKDRP